MLRWQDKEISEAQLKENEDEELEAEIRKLSHAEKIAGFVEESYNILDVGAGGGSAVLTAVAKVKKNLEDISRYDDSLANTYTMVEEAYISLQEAAGELRDYGESLEFQPAKLDKLQSRMDVIDRLCRKYGATIADVLEHQRKVQQELMDIENYDDDMARLEKEIALLEEKLGKKAAELTGLRQRAGKELAEAIGSQLAALGMPQAAFHIRVEPAGKFLANGVDSVAMYFSANPGEEEKLLSKVASGGELSRIALAIKTVAASRDSSVPSMVFDEIDTGISGETASKVAQMMRQLSLKHQVVAITHLPQIAAVGEQHLLVYKQTAENRTFTNIKELDMPERERMIATMMSGENRTETAVATARELLQSSQKT